MKALFSIIGKVVGWFVGSVSWVAPPWLIAMRRQRRERPARFWILTLIVLLTVVGGFVGYLYYLNLPRPLTVTAVIVAPELTPNVEKPVPGNLFITFEYDRSRLHSDQEEPEGPPSVARIDLVDKVVPSGIRLEPDMPGEWSWQGDRNLIFMPHQEWPAGTEFTVTFAREIFVPEAYFKDLSYPFATPDFSIELTDLSFYQDPRDRTVRKAVSTIAFSHPVNKASFEKRLAMTMRRSGEGGSATPKEYGFTITYDQNQREAYIHSEPIALPDQPNYLKLNLSQGVEPATGGHASVGELSSELLIPDLYSFLKVSSARTQIIPNEKREPEQVLILQLTDDIDEQELLSKLSVRVLPQKNSKRNSNYWSSPREVSQEVLGESESLELKLIPNEQSFSRTYTFIYDAPPGRFLYLYIDSGLISIGRFVTSTFYDAVLAAPGYPQELKIMGEGSVLSLSGAHQLSMLSRGIPAMKVEIGKLLPGQVTHLVSQTSGDIRDPYFSNYNFDSNNIVEYQQQIIELNEQHPKKANYSSINLTSYLPKSNDRFGLFFIKASGWDNKRKTEIYRVADKRLILVTDLGLLVKDNADQSHDLFVQSIKTGRPVEGVRVELLGRNGQPLFSRTTGADGHVQFPSTSGFVREQSPNVYVARTSADTSFLPFQRSDRQINYSPFDIGGVRGQHLNRDNLNAFLFTDRGIYRPGEEVKIGLIVKNNDFGNVEKIPLEIAIQGPRGNESRTRKIQLPEKGFFDEFYPSEPTADTGTYQVALYLVRDNQHRGRMIGSTSFRIEEFQPDTLKIESTLVGIQNQGWTVEKKIQARVKLTNLFGTPAQERKVAGRMTVQATSFQFSQYKDYTFFDPFYDPKKPHLSMDEMLKTQQTDADGVVTFDLPLNRFDQGTYLLTFSAEGFEPGGGRSVAAENRVFLSPLNALVGFKSDGKLNFINKDAERSVDLLAIGFDLKPRKMENLRARLIEVQQVSTLVQQTNGTFKYESVKREKEVAIQALSIADTGLRYRLPTANPGDYLLEILDSADLRLAKVAFSVVGQGNLLGRLEKNAELRLKLNKEDYKAGELVEMNITAPYSGAGLISIESDRVHAYKWFRTTSNSSMETIRIPASLEGSAYVNVTFVRDAGSKEIFTSPLSYAVAPFTIARNKRKLDVKLRVDPLVRPGKKLEVRYQVSAPSRIAIFAVDEGILQVAAYKTPQPLDYFLRKRALEVNTLQILDLILPEFDLVKEVSASGGGESMERKMAALAKNLNPFARKVDKPAVFWSGIVDADSAERVVSFEVPDTFAGNLRVMAVAVGDEAVGVAQEQTIVRGPFVLTPSVLTQAAPGDEFKVSVGVSNIIEGSGKDVPVTVRLEASKQLEIIGSNQVQLTISEGGEKTADFIVRVKGILGAAELKFFASAAGEEGRRSASLSVRPAIPYSASFSSGFEQSGTAELAINRLLYADLAEQKAAASASPLVLVDGLSSYLEHFPHGCTEQVVSQVFPLIGLMSHPSFAPLAKDNRARFDHLLLKLRERQLADGGFSFWPGGGSVSEFPSVYVMHFLIEAQQLGYAVPDDLLARGRAFLQNYVTRKANTLEEARIRAYALYLLTRMGEVTTNYLVNLQTGLEKDFVKSWKEDLTAVYMAASYQLLQKKADADALVSHYQIGKAGKGSYSDFHSPLTQDAQYVFLLSRHFKERSDRLDGEDILRLIEPVFKGNYNTIASAYTILALGAYSQQRMDGNFTETIAFSEVDSKGIMQGLKVVNSPFATAQFNLGSSKVLIKAAKPLFYLESQSGFDKTLPTAATRQGLEIIKDYLDETGAEVTRLEQGKEVTVRLRIRALDNRTVSNVAVIDLLPGGFEINLSSVPRTAYNWQADYVDVREDRIVIYGSFDSSVRELRYQAKVTAAGVFTSPPAFAESMYDRAVRAVSLAGTFEVVSRR